MNPKVEARQTTQQNERNHKKNPAAAQEVLADAEFKIQPGKLQDQAGIIKTNWRKTSTQVQA